MKQEKWICLSAFLSGVILISVLGNTGIENSILNRYNLASLSFGEIVYEEYFFQILLLRFRTVLSIWVVSKLLSKRLVSGIFLFGTCIMLGVIAGTAIISNGIWGVLLFFGALMPQILFYGTAYVLWNHMDGYGKEHYSAGVFVLVLIGIGCVCETYVNPVLIETIIKI